MEDLNGYIVAMEDAGDCGIDAPVSVSTDERRLHVRAYNHWVSLLRGRAFPAIEDIDPARMGEFSRYGVLLDFTANRRDPAIRYLGPELRQECGLEDGIETVGDVPRRTLLSRLTDHYLQIIASRAPVGFDAEFVNQRGLNTLYRGILMPFSSNGVTIDFIYGVINWKELADAELTAELMLQMDEALRRLPPLTRTAPLWADGPNATGGLDFEAAPARIDVEDPIGLDGLTFVEVDEVDEEPVSEEASLAARLTAARNVAKEADAADGRSRSALYHALGLAYDFALDADRQPDAYARLIEDAGIKVQARAPLTAVAKLVFGADYNKARLTEFATVLAHARRENVAAGHATQFIERAGGLKAIVAAERRLRNAAPTEIDWDAVRAALLRMPALGAVAIDGAEEFVLMIGRRSEDGGVDVIAPISDPALTQRALRKAAA
ncbi:hypothetical protein [Sphingomonas sp. ID0503]|uniref:PAS domain-containing protein n=1 Tax=Sphingomonas sp. ID0503 TaxID=3399691 RepID=UPI003AFA7AF8